MNLKEISNYIETYGFEKFSKFASWLDNPESVIGYLDLNYLNVSTKVPWKKIKKCFDKNGWNYSLDDTGTVSEADLKSIVRKLFDNGRNEIISKELDYLDENFNFTISSGRFTVHGNAVDGIGIYFTGDLFKDYFNPTPNDKDPYVAAWGFIDEQWFEQKNSDNCPEF